MAYQKCASIAQPPQNDPKRPYRVIGLVGWRQRCGWIEIAPVKVKIKCINDKTAEEDETTHRICATTAQPLRNAPNDSKRLYMVIGPRRQHRRIKFKSANVSRALKVKNAYLGRITTLPSNRRPTKHVRTINKLTLEYRMPGEPWRDDGDHG